MKKHPLWVLFWFCLPLARRGWGLNDATFGRIRPSTRRRCAAEKALYYKVWITNEKITHRVRRDPFRHFGGGMIAPRGYAT